MTHTIYTLAEIADLNQSSIRHEDDLQNIQYLDTGSIIENQIIEISTIPVAEAPSRARRKVKQNTIVYSTVRPRLRHYGILMNPPCNLIVSTGFITIDIKEEYKNKVDARYLFLMLTRPEITEHIACKADSAASAYPSINPSDIMELKFKIPNIKVQTELANIWNSLDLKIELNRQINDNLPMLDRSLTMAVTRRTA